MQGEDISESIFEDIKKIAGNDEKAKEILIGMKEDPNKKKILQFKSMFPLLSDKEIEEILKKYNWHSYDAFDDMLFANNKKEEQLQQIKIEEDKKKREKENNARVEQLMNQFLSITKEEIVKIFKENECDPQKTAYALTLRIEEQEKQNLAIFKKEEHAMKEKLRNTLIEKFPNLTKEEIVEALEKNNYEKVKSFEQLTKKSRTRILSSLKVEFTLLSVDEIKACAKKANWNHLETYRVCKDIQKQKEQIKQKQIPSEQTKKEQDVVLTKEDEIDISNTSVVFVDKFNSQQERKEVIVNQAFNKQIQEAIKGIIQPASGGEASLSSTTGGLKPHIEVSLEGIKYKAKVTLPGGTNYSWVGFFKKDAKDNNYLSYNYLCYLKENTFFCDIPKLNGEYEFRAFLSGQDRKCVSETIKIDKKDELSFTVQENENKITIEWKIYSFDPSKAYVTVHFANEQRPNVYRRWDWLRVNEGKVRFKKLVHAGEYEARVYIGNVLQMKSAPLQINGI